ncbi:MAG: hypothetical protein M0Q54_01030 [Pigmentiphaga sp.]|nr:hypothetical protein [Pigmentiphaga sp.]
MAVRRRGLTGNVARRLRVQARVDRRRGKQPYRRLIFLVTLVLGAALGSALYEAAQHWWKGPPPMTLEEADDLRRQVDSFRQENEQLRKHLMATESRLILERAAKDSLEEEMRSAQRELGDLRDNLTFFEQLIPTDPRLAQLSIRSAEMDQQDNFLQYRMLLMRTGRASGEFRGRLQFSAAGEQDGKPVTVELLPLAASTDMMGAGQLELRFRQYQRTEGTLWVPAGLEVKRVTVRVLEGKVLRAQTVVNLSRDGSS